MEDYLKAIQDIIQQAIQSGASDIHLSPAHYPMMRVDGHLLPLSDMKIVDDKLTEGIANAMMEESDKKRFEENKDVDFTYQLNDSQRFRTNIYRSKGAVALVLHAIPQQIKTMEELRLPQTLKMFTNLSQGLVLVAGATGQGKSATVAALIDVINKERTEKILTIEDPIEYIFVPERSIIDQREFPNDIVSFDRAIKAVSRENINVLMVGEMRDADTINATIDATETGHLVFSTMYTTSATRTIERIINLFPGDQKSQITSQLASSLSGIISQRLIPSVKGGLVPAVEVLVANRAVRNVIRAGSPEQLDLIIETGEKEGMVSMNRSLVKLIQQGDITEENARYYSPSPQELKNLLK
ncbi:MAG: PilT/PilU family type 4a pilus ATPase [Parcubacteria group bacterium]